MNITTRTEGNTRVHTISNGQSRQPVIQHAIPEDKHIPNGDYDIANDDLLQIEQFRRQLGFRIGARVQRVCTALHNRVIGRLPMPENAERIKTELKQGLSLIAYGLMVVPDQIDLHAKIMEWAGGGFIPSTPNEAQKAAGQHLGLSDAEINHMAQVISTNNRNRLALRRAGQAEQMLGLLERAIPEAPNECPDADIWTQSAIAAYWNAFQYGDAGALILIKASMDEAGIQLPQRTQELDATMAEKAERVRQRLADQLAEQVAKDNEAIKTFDPSAIWED